jgi:hypothetical protein
MILKEVGFEAVGWIHLAIYWSATRTYEHGNDLHVAKLAL